MTTFINVIWIDENYDNEENNIYLNELKSYFNLIVNCFKEVEKGLEYIKKIEFEETNIIISGKLYIKFIKNFKKYIKDIYIVPKIIIFTKSKSEFVKKNIEHKNYFNNSFYNLGGIKEKFEDIKNFIFKPLNKPIRKEEDKLTFEYINCKEELYYPILYKSLIETTKIDKIENVTNKIYDEYNKYSNKIKNLLNQIRCIPDIPIELIAKYYARLYTAESENNQNNFYNDINQALRGNKKDNYLSYIKVLYEGIKKKSLLLASNNILYRGARLSNTEIDIIKKYLHDKIKGLPGAIVFSKTFLSFSKDKKIAENYLKHQENKDELKKVLFILEKDNNLDYDLSTHADIEKISFYPNEKEVLFLPFSSFEIKGIKKAIINNEIAYEIELLYLGKYIKELKNNKDNTILPDSKFKNQILEFGLIEKEEIEDNPKYLLQKFDEYEKEINNYITSEINIKEDDLNKDIRIINSYEEYYRELNLDIFDEYKNENEIKDNIEITINDEPIPFSYFYKFKEKSKYIIKYIFKNNLTKTDFMFYGCEYLINMNLSHFQTIDVTNMSSMFSGCKSLIKINLDNINTQKVTNMRSMFSHCESLKQINLSSFDTQNVANMNSMFYECKNLKYINLSNFNTQNVTNMNSIFYGCNSLKEENVLTKDNKILREIIN